MAIDNLDNAATKEATADKETTKKEKKKKMPKEQRTPFKELSFIDKIKYIIEYYWLMFAGIALVLLFAGSLAYSIYMNNYDTVCSIVCIDGKIDGYDNHTDIPSVEFTQYLGIDGKDERVEINYNYSLLVKNAMDKEAEISYKKLHTLIYTGNIDGYLSDITVIDYFASDSNTCLVDLREILSAEELEKIGEDNIIYYTFANGKKIPFAVNLTNTKIKQNTNLTIETPCYGVVQSGKNYVNGANFIRYAFGLEKKDAQ